MAFTLSATLAAPVLRKARAAAARELRGHFSSVLTPPACSASQAQLRARAPAALAARPMRVRAAVRFGAVAAAVRARALYLG